jgi:hypothetical protein
MARKLAQNPKKRSAGEISSPITKSSTKHCRKPKKGRSSTNTDEASSAMAGIAGAGEAATHEDEARVKAEDDMSIKAEVIEEGSAEAPIEVGEDPVEKYDEVIYEGGDMVAIVGNPSTRYLVSSHILKQASEEWKKQIKGYVKEIHFIHDPKNNMVKILYLVHHRPHQALEKPTFGSLVSLAHICHKYSLVSLVRSHIKHWSLEWKDKLKTPGYEEWLYVAWVLGLKEECEQLARHLLETITSNTQHHCLTSTGKRLDDDVVHMPPGIIGTSVHIHLIYIR